MRSKNSKCKGNALIEFALSSAVLLLFFTGSFRFGYALYSYNLLCSAVNSGASYAAFRTYRTNTSASVEKAKTAARNMVAYGTVTPSQNTPSLVRGMDPSKVNVVYTLSSTGVPTSVRVSINAFTLDAVFSTFTFTGKPSVTYPFMGRFAPEESE